MLAVLSFACSLTLVTTFLFLADKNHGVILIPEGLVESIPELYALLKVLFGKLFFWFLEYQIIVSIYMLLMLCDAGNSWTA